MSDLQHYTKYFKIEANKMGVIREQIYRKKKDVYEKMDTYLWKTYGIYNMVDTHDVSCVNICKYV